MPPGQGDRFKAIRELRVSLDRAQCLWGSQTHQGYLEFITEVLQHLQKLPLLADRPCDDVVDLVDDDHPHVEPLQQADDLPLFLATCSRE